jgi:lipid A 3-O-deacylase
MNAIARFGAARQVVSLTLLLLTHVAPAQERLPPVDNGKWDVSVWIAGATGEQNRDSLTESQIWTAGVFAGRVITNELGKGWLRGNLEYGFNLIPAFVNAKNQTIYGGGFEPVVLRWNSSHHTARVVPYIELAGGAVFTTSNLPPGDTSSFNFTTRGGGGIQIFSRDRRSWDVGLHYFHVSNANLADKNPEFNGVQISLGYHWFR